MHTLRIPPQTTLAAACARLALLGLRVDPRRYPDGLHLRPIDRLRLPAVNIRAAALRVEVLA